MSDNQVLVQQAAKNLREYVKSMFGDKLKAGHSQQIVAAALGFKSYASLLTTDRLVVGDKFPYFFPRVIDLKLAGDAIHTRIEEIPSINQQLLMVSDELAIQSKIGFHPKCSCCGTASNLRWPIPFIEGEKWVCRDCLSAQRIDNNLFKDRIKLEEELAKKLPLDSDEPLPIGKAKQYMDTDYKELKDLAAVNSIAVWDFALNRYLDTNRSVLSKITEYKTKDISLAIR